MLLFLVPAAVAGCPARLVELQAEIDAASAAYVAMDLDRFTGLAEAAREDAACLEEPAPAELARRLHQVLALWAWVRRDPAATTAALRGALAVDPLYDPGDDLAPAGGRLRSLYDAARAAAPSAPRPVGVELRVDGRASRLLPVDRAALVQLEQGGLRSWYLDGSGVPEELEAALAPAPVRRGHPSRGLLVAGLVTGAVAGGALAWAAVTRADYPEAPDRESAEALYRQNQVLGWGGYGLGVVALGLGAGAVVVGRW